MPLIKDRIDEENKYSKQPEKAENTPFIFALKPFKGDRTIYPFSKDAFEIVVRLPSR